MLFIIHCCLLIGDLLYSADAPTNLHARGKPSTVFPRGWLVETERPLRGGNTRHWIDSRSLPLSLSLSSLSISLSLSLSLSLYLSRSLSLKNAKKNLSIYISVSIVLSLSLSLSRSLSLSLSLSIPLYVRSRRAPVE